MTTVNSYCEITENKYSLRCAIKANFQNGYGLTDAKRAQMILKRKHCVKCLQCFWLILLPPAGETGQDSGGSLGGC